MAFTNNTLCPHCGRLTTDGGEATDDHVFPEAFGGRDTIRACKWCNSGLGSGVEGKLLKPPSRFVTRLHEFGLPNPMVPVTTQDGRQFKVDLATGEHIAKTSVEVTNDADGTQLVEMFGSLDEVAKHKANFERKYGAPLEIVNAVVGSPDDPPVEGNIDVLDDMRDHRRFVAKTALCAMTYLHGDPFIESPLAVWLRDVLDAPREWPAKDRRMPRADPDGIGASTRSFDTADISRKFQGELARRGFEQVDLSAALVTMLIAPSERYPSGPKTLFVMSLLGEVLLTGLLAPYLPIDRLSSVMLVQHLKQRIEVIDFAGGAVNA
jgi:hypothetical protein